MEDRTLTITTGEGEEILCDILFTHYEEKFKKHYVVFCAKDTNEASAAVYIENASGEGELAPVESEEEWAMLEELLDQYASEHEGLGCGDEACSCGCEDGMGCSCENGPHEHNCEGESCGYEDDSCECDCNDECCCGK